MTRSNDANRETIERQQEQIPLIQGDHDPAAGLPFPAILTFWLDGHVHGLPVSNVVQIIEMMTITPLPNLPEAISGVVNIHGQVVPVMDLRRRFGLPSLPYGLHTPIILAELGEQTIGLVVDRVEAVLEDVEAAPACSQNTPALQFTDDDSLSPHPSLFARLLLSGSQLIPLLQLNALFNCEVIKQLGQATPQPTLSGVPA